MLNFLKGKFNQPGSLVPLGGRYQVMRRLAAGGFGQTFLARDLHLPGHPVCVVKQLKPRFSDTGSLETARRLFDTEAQVLYELGHHSQIPRLMAHFEEDQEFYLAQEYVEGEPLSEVWVSGQTWEAGRVMALLRDILRVLSFVHEKNVIHRDIKPANLLCRRRDGQVVLIDFGAVKQVNTAIIDPQRGRTNLTVSIGTQGYMPSEQLSGQPRFSSDVYAVGMVAVQALTGVAPHHLTEDPTTGEVDWRAANPQVTQALDPGLADLLDHMVYYDFRARYATAAVALAALEALPAGLQSSIPERWYVPTELPDTSVEDSSDAVALPAAESSRASSQPTEVVGDRSDLSEPLTATTLAPGTSIFTARVWILGGLAGLVGLALLRLGIGLMTPELGGERAASPDSSTALDEAPEAPLLETTSEGDTDPEDSPNPADDTPPPSPQPNAAESAAPAAEAAIAQANTLRQQGQYPQALAAYEQAIAASPDSAEAHWGQCYSLNRLQQPEAAIAACDRALALKPDHADALSSKGYALQLQGKNNAALVLFDRAVASDPSNADALTNRGTALLLLGQYQQALASFDEAIAVQPDMPEAWSNRGAALWESGRRDEAAGSVEKALTLRPDYAEAQQLRQAMRNQGY